jgi:MFS family permease
MTNTNVRSPAPEKAVTSRDTTPRVPRAERRQLLPLAGAEFAVLLGGQAWFVAVTWILIERGETGSTIGFVLMIGAIPRAILMLLGGAITDRYRPVIVLRIATAAMAALIAIAAVLQINGEIPIWQLALLAGLFGATDAFFYPAVGGLIPQIVAPERRNRANALIQVCDQLTQIAGPVMAGILIARQGEVATLSVIGSCFAVGLVALMILRAGPRSASAEREPSVRGAIGEALRFAWRTLDVRLCLIVAAALSLGTVGPVSVGGALLASERLGGAQSLGVLLGSFGVGAFVGVVIAAVTTAPRSMRTMLAVTSAAIGIGIGTLGASTSLLMACAIALPTGVAAGYLGVAATTAIQNHTPLEMQGRMSSLLMFAFFALDPVSQGLSGLLVSAGIGPLFAVAGAFMLGAAALVAGTRARTSPSTLVHTPIERTPT